MNDFTSLEKLIVRELSCRLCLCNDVIKLKPLNDEIKRKLKKLFNITIRQDDNLPKAICHDCLQSLGNMYLYAIKVDKTQKFLQFQQSKMSGDVTATLEKHHSPPIPVPKQSTSPKNSKKASLVTTESSQQGDTPMVRVKSPTTTTKPSLKRDQQESMTLEEFANSEMVDKALLRANPSAKLANTPRISPIPEYHTPASPIVKTAPKEIDNTPKKIEPIEELDPIVLINGRPARQGAALDRQISLFYKMECRICHETGFNFKSLMKHYKERHGVAGYVTCCDKKFPYFQPKRIIEHMAYHLQPNIFRCPSCQFNFQCSQELREHQANGGRSEGKILCPRCSDRYPTYRELGWHLISHREDSKPECDYCGKTLKHRHRKRSINNMEGIIVCSQCARTLRNIEKQEKENKEKLKAQASEQNTTKKRHTFHDVLDLSADDSSTN